MSQKITSISMYTKDGGWSTPVPIGSQVVEASATVAGVIKKYASTGTNTDGTMTQAAITSAIDAAKTTINAATSTTAGVTKIYSATGTNTDGTMTQAAITDALGSGETVEVTAAWSSTTTTLTGDDSGAYYSRSITMTADHGDHPTVMLIPGGTNTVPTQDQIEAFNSVDFIVANGTALTLYAKARIITAFVIYVEG